jgi:catechol 2,3-dioxygenase-like lactoylglutathione lyase family enzyme
MLAESNAFSSFAVDDLDRAREFYGDTLGLNVEMLEQGPGLLSLHLPGRDVLVYGKDDNRPANHTILNFPVDDVYAEVDDLASRGVEFERYEGFDQDEKGIARGLGPDIAWFKDPAGNILAVLREG